MGGTARRLHVALEVDGADPFDLAALARRVALAETAGVTLVTIADSPVPPAAEGRIEAGVRAAFLSQRTRRIGLAPALQVTTTEPFHLATLRRAGAAARPPRGLRDAAARAAPARCR